jgi:hypothetical protein
MASVEDNLELWTRPQPAGIRVSDVINWARSICDQYVANGSPPTMLTLASEDPSVRVRPSVG